MFKNLSSNLSKIFDRLRSGGVLTEAQIDEAMRGIRVALLEADVALSVVKNFVDAVKNKAIGQNVIKSVSPGQMVVKIIHDELILLLASTEEERQINLRADPPVNIMTVGLQGSGKTTFSAKLALYLKAQHLKSQSKKILLVSLDTYRPAAQEQLAILAKSAEIASLPIISEEKPLEIVQRALKGARLGGYDVVIYDTAGRIHIDDVMMKELEDIKALTNPTEILLVADALTGQDAVNIASQFDAKLNITGVVLSKIDGDARGGAALSIKYITKKPIKFLSTGEKLSDLELFQPERVAGRILDMGDVVSFVEKAAEAVDEAEAAKAAARLQKGLFNMNDYLTQLRSIKKIGGFASILGMLPGAGKMLNQVDLSKKEKEVKRSEAIILSMTKKERRKPDLINASRRKRIAEGSGTSVQDVNKMLKQYLQISSMMKKASRMGPKTLMRSGMGQFFS
ncbi:MAG: signal recognition particle protein [Pseudomonadota bacterium]